MKTPGELGLKIVFIFTIPGWIIALIWLVFSITNRDELLLEYKKVNAIVTDTATISYATTHNIIYTLKYVNYKYSIVYGEFIPANTEKEHRIGDNIEVFYSTKTNVILSPNAFFVKKYLVVEFFVFFVLIIPTLVGIYYLRNRWLKFIGVFKYNGNGVV